MEHGPGHLLAPPSTHLGRGSPTGPLMRLARQSSKEELCRILRVEDGEFPREDEDAELLNKCPGSSRKTGHVNTQKITKTQLNTRE